ncbi:type II toxin-antitoxin system RelE/ParE family toxin [Avibacterium paragallinarum]|uniref:type II toxin-antitoxin system RelE/ParE family toxin n=1 Tax=Avibacterium TaxID=292486 RepID=UPI00021AD187|nr:type II toxin-antitoxin system mRNA interferase toxin, RelE/StbE family [Avibacterium paragallinarum]CDF99614.1 Hypothetical Addiction module toxin component,YafQ family [Avibacterium paragallinarum JF4211]
MNQPLPIKEIEMAKEFKRDLVQLAKKAPHLFVHPRYLEVMHCLTNGLTLPAEYKNHPLKNNLKGYMDCHILNDLVLIYKIEQQCLKLVRLNTHSEVFA